MLTSKNIDKKFIVYSLTSYESNSDSFMISGNLVKSASTGSFNFINSERRTFSAHFGNDSTGDTGQDYFECDMPNVITKSVSVSNGSTLNMTENDRRYSLQTEGNIPCIDADIHQKSLSYQNATKISDDERMALEFALQTKRNGSDAIVLTESNSGVLCGILYQEGVTSIPLSESGYYDSFSH